MLEFVAFPTRITPLKILLATTFQFDRSTFLNAFQLEVRD
jgi:hypothetical protein